jgi:hypothetical protein
MNKILLLLPLFLFNLFTNAQTGPLTDICLVTVDTTFTHNVVVWERGSQTSANPIDSIRIYRAKLLGGDTLVGSVHWDSVSQFRDYSADPNLRPYRYRISGVDNQGLEGPLSLPHQTIHFAILEQGDSIRLRWTKYMGQSVNYYNCWIDSAGSGPGVDLLYSTLNDVDTSWWHSDTPLDWTGLGYLVDVDWSGQCSATKAQDHNTTRSNRSISILPNPIGIYEESIIREVGLFPNPTNETSQLIFSSKSWSPIAVFITDVMGRRMKQYKPIKVLGQHQIDIDLEPYNSGMYNVIIIQNNRVYSQKLLKL